MEPGSLAHALDCSPGGARSLKVAVLQRNEAGSGEVIAFYVVLLGDTWKAWGSSGL